ncbi:MAG: serine hydrolase domain-containing protein [Bacteroidota bacterium]
MNLQIIVLAIFISLGNYKATESASPISTKPVANQSPPLVEVLISELIGKMNLPGLSLAVSKNNQVIYAKGFGYSDVENKIRMTTETRIRTASVAKVITATGLGRLVSEGKLDLDAPIKNYIPYISTTYANLTTRQLAGHTAGVIHRKKGMGYTKKQYTEVQDMVNIAKDEPLLFEPNTDYHYSTYAFSLLAAVIEGASGHRYTNYLAGEIFGPLSMNQTSPENLKQLTDSDARCYFFQKGKRKLKKQPTNGSYKLAGAAFRSTPTDLVKMMHGYSNGLIASETVKEMFTSHQLKNGEKTNVGIAWRSSFDPFGNAPVDHAGFWMGARTVVVHYPEQQLSISIMTNAQVPFFIEETAHIIAQLFMEKETNPSVINDFNQTVKVTTHFNENTKNLTGQLKIEGQKGQLEVATDGFLATNKIHYLGFGNHYAMVTSLGLLYLQLDNQPNLEGKIFLYENRNKQNPVKGRAAVSVQPITK